MTNHLGVSSDSDISAWSLNLGLADGDQVVFVHDLGVDIEFDTVHHFVLEEDDGVVVADGCLEETTGVLNVPGADDLKSWDGRVPRAEALGVLGTDAAADSINTAEYNGAGEVTSRHVKRLGS